jgi:hypothetical protein
MSVSNRCAPGAGGTGSVSFAPGSLEGTNVRAGNPDPHAIPNQSIVDALNRAASLLPAGFFPQITPDGGRAARGSTHNHPSGDAADIQIVGSNGVILRPGDAPSVYESFISGLIGDTLIDGIVAGIGLYSWGIHFDQSSWRQTGSGGIATWNGWGTNPSPGPASVLQNGIAQGRRRAASNQYTTRSLLSDGTSGTNAEIGGFITGFGEGQVDPALAAALERSQQQRSTCSTAANTRTTGGCSPVSALAIGSVASLINGNGLSVPAKLTQAINNFQNSPFISQASNIIQQVTSITAQAEQLISNPLSQLTPEIGSRVIGLGSDSIFSALTGRLPLPVAQALGEQTIISNSISSIANQVFANGDLARFSNIFNTTLGATGTAQGLGQSLNQIQSQIFGNSRNIIGNTGNVFESVAGMSIDTLAGGLIQNLIGDQSQILQTLLGNQVTPFAAFGSVYRDFNSMVTQGLGSITGNINLLGRDLQTLGNLANLQDLLRIGTPGQIVEQLAWSGADAVSSSIAGDLTRNNISIAEINSPEYDDLALEILGSVQDRAVIDDAFEKLNIKRSTNNIKSLADLTDKNILFPNSKDENNFNNLNQISLHLAVCGAQGFDNLEQLGNLLVSMESIATEDSVKEFVTPVSIDEISALKSALSPTSEYSGDNDLTIADFLGTAAGYRHTETLPLMKELLDDLNSNSITNNYQLLNVLLSETLNGDYTVSPDIIVPNTAGYTFGTYDSMNSAVSAIVDAIESEIDIIESTASGDTVIKLRKLQSYHDEISHQLFKEHKLRQYYGINLSDSSESIEIFGGDGSTSVFQLTGTVGSSRSVSVFVDGVKQSSSKIAYNSSTKRLTITVPPAAGVEIEVIYDNAQEPIVGNLSDIWNFASNLENFGIRTGFGREADFISRVTSDDSDGVRIKATMIQARNRQRAADADMECPGYNRTLSSFYEENINGVTNYANLTGVWSPDPKRAAEIYLQNREIVNSRQEYIANRIKSNGFAHQPVFDKIMSKVNKQLIFYTQGSIAITNTAANLYTDFKDSFKSMQFQQDNQNFVLDLNNSFSRTGFLLGPYTQIISEILRIEAIESIDFVDSISDQTNKYLQSIGVELPKLVGVLQKTMLVNASNYLGLDATDVRDIFGMPSVSRYLLANIANRL